MDTKKRAFYLLVLSSFFLIFTVVSLSNTFRFYHESVETSGTVVKVEKKYNGGDDIVWLTTVRYLSNNQVKYYKYNSYVSIKVGTRVKLLVDQNITGQPTTHRNSQGIWKTPIFLFALTLLFGYLSINTRLKS